jgi:hypothetical protein
MNTNKLKIDENTVVHCETEELANEVLSIAKIFGHDWYNSYPSKHSSKWYEYRNKTLYDLHQYTIGNDVLDFGSNTKIISAQEFIDLHKLEKLKEKVTDKIFYQHPKEQYNINQGQKFDEGKLPMFTVLVKQFPNAVKEIVKCSQAGHIKYPNDTDYLNYQRVDLTDNPNRYLDAATRHLFESEGELKLNEDMKEYGDVLHLAQFIWNGLAHLEIKLNGNKD